MDGKPTGLNCYCALLCLDGIIVFVPEVVTIPFYLFVVFPPTAKFRRAFLFSRSPIFEHIRPREANFGIQSGLGTARVDFWCCKVASSVGRHERQVEYAWTGQITGSGAGKKWQRSIIRITSITTSFSTCWVSTVSNYL